MFCFCVLVLCLFGFGFGFDLVLVLVLVLFCFVFSRFLIYLLRGSEVVTTFGFQDQKLLLLMFHKMYIKVPTISLFPLLSPPYTH